MCVCNSYYYLTSTIRSRRVTPTNYLKEKNKLKPPRQSRKSFTPVQGKIIK